MEARPDTGHSLTDCISMQTMCREGPTDAPTNDPPFAAADPPPALRWQDGWFGLAVARRLLQGQRHGWALLLRGNAGNHEVDRNG